MPFALREHRHGDPITEVAPSQKLAETTGISAKRWQNHRCGHWHLATAYPSTCLLFNEQTEPEESANTRLFALDGHLSNRHELDQRLRDRPSPHQSDIALIARLFHEFGDPALDWLQGSFAICVVESLSGIVHARRDYQGGRILYWQDHAQETSLATSAAILAILNPSRTENPEYVSSIFTLRTNRQPGISAFTGIHETLPGERLRIQEGRIESIRMPFAFHRPDCSRPVDQCIDDFRKAMNNSVRAAIGRDGPVATMLSGGMDSGPMLVTAKTLLAETDRKLVPISWLLPDHPEADESRWIKRLCRFLELPLQSFPGDTLLPFNDLSSASINPELPAHNPYRELINGCYQLAATQGLKIILNGGAGDKLYPPASLLLADQWHHLGFQGVLFSLREMVRYSGWRELVRDPSVRRSVGRWRPFRHRKARFANWLTPWACKHAPEIDPAWPPEADDHPHPSYARDLLGQKMAQGNPQESNYANRFGLDRRDPFASQGLVQAFLQMPVNLSIRDGYEKWIMRQVMIAKMPESLRTKPRTGLLHSFMKAGFDKNRTNIHTLLFKRQTVWQRYVKPEVIADALADEKPNQQHLLLVNQCVAYSLWRSFWEE